MNILIVDDESLARERLTNLVQELDKQHTILEAENGLSALQVYQENTPEIILLDIRMPVMDGIETAFHLSKLDPPPAIIFTTAYQDHAIDAFEANAVDYLLKPIRRSRLEQAMEKARLMNMANLSKINQLDITPATRTHLSSKNYGKLELIPINEIDYLKADQKYVIVGRNGTESIIDESLKSLESEFPNRFLRIHRNAMVVPEAIVSLEKQTDKTFCLRLRNTKEPLQISRRHISEVREVLKQIGENTDSNKE